MTEELQSSGATTEQVGGAEVQEQSDVSQTETKSVRFEDHKRALDDLHKYKSQVKSLREQQAAIEAKARSLEETQLAAEGKKDELLERYRADLEAERAKAKRFVESFYEDKKYNAVLAEARRLGLREEATEDLSLLSLDGVEVEQTDQGRVIVHNAASVAERFKQTKPHWFKDTTVPNVNSGGARGPVVADQLTPELMVELERTDPVKFRELYPKFKQQMANKRRTYL